MTAEISFAILIIGYLLSKGFWFSSRVRADSDVTIARPHHQVDRTATARWEL